MRRRLAVGCMTGTSLDGLDVAVMRIEGAGLGMRAEFVEGGGRGFEGGGFVEVLRGLARGEVFDAQRVSSTVRAFALFHAEVIREVLDHARAGRPDLVCVHGQTVFHRPPVSWQLFNPWPLAQHVGAPVVFDLRGADLAAGGQGAPITPIADWVLFRRTGASVCVVNLGGFCNYTWIPADSREQRQLERIAARDVCACNHILDEVARCALGAAFDPGGSSAAMGNVDERAVAELQETLSEQSREGRSLGTGDEARQWIRRWHDRLHGSDLARSAAEGIARAIASSLPTCESVLLAGGGGRHRVLAERLAALAGVPCGGTDTAGVPATYREAACMGVLGTLCQDGVPITLPQVTGVPAPAPVAGCWTHVPCRTASGEARIG